MSTRKVLIPRGMTPTGFGLMLFQGVNDKWYLRPLSPCCGAPIDCHNDYICQSCMHSWKTFQDTTDATIGNNVSVDSTIGVLQTWIEGFTKLEEVEVRIAWMD